VLRRTPIADFGRFEVLGTERSGVTDGYRLVEPLTTLLFSYEGPGEPAVVEELRRHASKGAWEAVGAWKVARNCLRDPDAASDVIDAGLLALAGMRMTNLAIHLAPIDEPRFVELTGGPPPNDGFFGPPVFDSSYGPSRQYYFDHALSTAASRVVQRLPSSPGVEPGPVEGQ